jgi:hypothetical protein
MGEQFLCPHPLRWLIKCYVIFTGELLSLETKQPGVKKHPHSVLRGGGSISKGGITRQKMEEGYFFRILEV